MRLSKTSLTIWARTLITAFLFVLVGKDWHAFTAHAQEHEHSCCHHDHDCHDGGTSISEKCAVCDFDFFKAEAASYFFYAPLLRVVQIERPLLSHKVVYQTILFVNAHSPPSTL